MINNDRSRNIKNVGINSTKTIMSQELSEKNKIDYEEKEKLQRLKSKKWI